MRPCGGKSRSVPLVMRLRPGWMDRMTRLGLSRCATGYDKEGEQSSEQGV